MFQHFLNKSFDQSISVHQSDYLDKLVIGRLYPQVWECALLGRLGHFLPSAPAEVGDEGESVRRGEQEVASVVQLDVVVVAVDLRRVKCIV